jgi:2-dehydro-3-deoxygluconokinase
MNNQKNVKKIVTFGEIMLRLAPYNFERLIQAKKFQIIYGGGEANVAVSLAAFGDQASFVSRLPKNMMGDAALNSLRAYGVDINYIIRGGSRLGIYFIEHGASIRPSKVLYDRANSATSQIEPGMVDWEMIFNGKDWFHITGITPALSKSCASVSLEAVRAAKKAGLMVSCDLNYRKKLWTREEANRTMSELVQYVDLIIANEEDAADVFDIHAVDSDITGGSLSAEGYRSVAERLAEASKAKYIAITLRESLSASDNNWSALLYDGSQVYTSKKYPLHIVDRVGGGDSFGAGLIHALVNDWDSQKALDFAVAASAMKHTIPGDMNLVSEQEVLTVAGGDLSGRVQR